MYSNEEFRKIVLEKYPDAIIHIDKEGYGIAVRKTEKSFELLGCALCFGENNLEIINNHLFIQGKEAISPSSVIEDDSLNLAMNMLFFCPVCSRMIVNQNAKSPVLGRVIESWKD